MTLDQYSIVISLGLFALTALVVGAGIAALVSPRVRDQLLSMGYWPWMHSLFFVAGAAVVGAMVYQLVYETPVCELCWWQRVLLFPVVVIAGVALWKRGMDSHQHAHITVAILSVLGLAVALYHYYFHLQGLILGNVIAVPCGGGLLAVCGDSPILTFGFVTIPFMGILTFSVLLILSAFAGAALRGRRAV